MFYDTKRKYHNDISYIPFLHISSPRSLVTYISYYHISCLSYEYILSVSYNCFLVNMTYIRSILYIHFNISHHTLETYHVSYEVSYMI